MSPSSIRPSPKLTWSTNNALARHAVSALYAGAVGFLVPAMAAEVATLTDEERLGMVSAVVGAIGRRIPIIAGASAASQAERLKNAGRLAAAGCDIVLLSQPYTSEEQYIREIGEIAAASGLPLMIQDWDATGSGVPIPAILAAFEAVDQQKYLKVETANAGQKYTALKRATGGQLHVSGGWAVTQLIEALDRGAMPSCRRCSIPPMLASSIVTAPAIGSLP